MKTRALKLHTPSSACRRLWLRRRRQNTTFYDLLNGRRRRRNKTRSNGDGNLRVKNGLPAAVLRLRNVRVGRRRRRRGRGPRRQ